MNIIIKWVFKTVVGRWVTAGILSLLVGGGALKWHNYKEDLIHKGQQVCVQEINKETVAQLEDALAAAEIARAELKERLDSANRANALALDRRRELETSLTALADEMEKQRNEDPTYREWSDSDLPDGVAGRLRDQATGRDPGPIRDD